MKIWIIISSLFLIVACDTKSNSKNKNSERTELFQNFIRKFKPINLPYVFRLTDKDDDNIGKLQHIDGKSPDTLFIKSEDIDEIYCLGYLTDTSKFYSLIYMFPADSYYPVLVTYTKDGKLISQNDLLANGCEDDCGLHSWSENALINKDFHIFCSDTVRWDYFCDSIGNPKPNSSEKWIFYKNGKVKSNGKIEIGKTHEIKIKNNP